ncbi:MAG: Ig-like domain repeat protein [Gemmatimonadales bacterium]
MLTARVTRRLAPALVLLLSCGGGDLVLPAEGEPAAIEVVQGDAQSGRVGLPLAEPVVGRVTDSQGRPVVDVSVAFAFTTDGTDATVAPDAATTNADGRASFQVVMGARVGESRAELRVLTAGGQRTLTAPVRFTAVSSDANLLQLVSGDDQSAPVGGVLAEPLVVQVTDGFGNPVPGVSIAWTPNGGGSVSVATTTTGSDGLASVVRTLGPSAGTQQTAASAPGLAGSPVVFMHTATAGAAAVLEKVSGDGQSAVVGTSLPEPLVVSARDGDGNAVVGLAVAWVGGSGGGSLTPATSLTDAAGRASTQWTLGSGTGTNTATAVVSGVGTVGFTATALPGTPPGLSLETQPPASAQHGVALSRRPVVQLREPDGSFRRQSGVQVSVSVVEGGATLRGTLARTTGGDGRVEFRDLALAGPPGTYTLAFAATGFTGVTSSAIVLTRASTTTTIRSDDPDPSAVGAPVRVRFEVTSPGGTPGGSVTVSSDDGASCSASVAAGECTLTLTAAGTRTLTAAYAGDTQFEGSFASENHRVDVPPQPLLALRTQPSATATVGQAFARQPVVQLRAAGGSDLKTSGISVTAEVASGGGSLGGTTTRTTDNDGRATFTDLSIGGAAGSHTLRFRATGFTDVTSDPVDVQAAGPVSTTTTITAHDPDPSEIGQAVTVRYTVAAAAGTPTGTVTVSASATESCLGSVAAGSCSLTLTTPGDRTLTAAYAGDGSFAASTINAAHTVRAAPPPPVVPSASTSTIQVKDATLDLGKETDVTVVVRDASNATLENITVTLSATGSGNTTTPGSVTTSKNGEAKFKFLSLGAGLNTLTAVAGGVTLQAQPTISVAQASTTTNVVSDAPDPSTPGASVTVQFAVTSDAGTPTGSVTVTGDGQSCQGSLAPSGAQGSCTLTLTTAGTVTLVATYSGDANFISSQDQESHTVAAATLVLATQPSTSATSGLPFDRQPQVQLRGADGNSLAQAGVTITAGLSSGTGSLIGTVSGTTDASGRVTFTDLGISGSGSDFTTSFTASGFAAVTSATITVATAPTSTSILSDDPDPSAVGQDVTVAFRVTSSRGTPTGSVNISDQNGPLCTGPLTDGAGSCTTSFDSPGDRTLTASYAGNSTFDSSDGTASHTVTAPEAGV